jgi:DNA-binding response OmpR family regulator
MNFLKDNITKPVSKDELIKKVNEMLTDNNYHLTNSKNRRAGNNK